MDRGSSGIKIAVRGSVCRMDETPFHSSVGDGVAAESEGDSHHRSGSGHMQSARMREERRELMFLAPESDGDYRPLICQCELRKAVDEVLVRRMFTARCGVLRIPVGQALPMRRCIDGGVLDPAQRIFPAPQGAIPSSDVAKLTGMMLHIGMERMKEFVSVPGVVTIRPGDVREGELVVLKIKSHQPEGENIPCRMAVVANENRE